MGVKFLEKKRYGTLEWSVWSEMLLIVSLSLRSPIVDRTGFSPCVLARVWPCSRR